MAVHGYHPSQLLKTLAFVWISGLACCGLVSADDIYFDRVKPVLQARCYACHGALKQEGGLRLDAVDFILTGSDSGEIVTSGEPQNSLVMERITAEDETLRMPPEGAALSADEIGAVSAWIERGLPVPRTDTPEASPLEHWAYQPIKSPVMEAAVSHDAQPENPIDVILAAHHRRQSLQAMPLVDRRRLARRVYLDLLGVPPSLSEIDRFVDDQRPDAYGILVDTLLQRPEYGQRWGRHWMDIWRYSDWYGLGDQLRDSQKHLWHWRDWIIESLNSDKPYDEMIVAMLAGDELAPRDPQTIRATGFLARNYYLFNRTTWLDNTIEHTAKAFLGLTFNCAKCHDHKYDPLTQQDYYALRAILEPHQVRLDAVPGETDLEVNSYPRAFDAHPQVQTYLHVRGNEKDPDLEHPIQPAVPTFLSHLPFVVETVDLPWQAFRPELREFARRDRLAEAGELLTAARLQLKQLSVEETKGDPNSLKRDIAQKRVRQAALRLPYLLAVYESELAEVTRSAKQADEMVPLKSNAVAAWRSYELARVDLEVTQAKAKIAEQDNAENQQLLKDTEQRRQQVAEAMDESNVNVPVPRGSRKALEGPAETEESRYAAYPGHSTGRRLALARWIVNPLNPLTARVAVNHIWGRHFGEPLVDPVEDFGRRTKEPPLSDLLDFLASQLMQDEWQMKSLHRMIVTSNAYRRGAASRNADIRTVQADPNNRFHWCWGSKRMESQTIRDSILSLADGLDHRLGGPSVDPKKQPLASRRSLYFLHSRDDQHRFLNMFDDADILRCYRRQSSVLPQQALTLMNSEIPLAMASQIADRVSYHADVTRGNADFVSKAFEFILCRLPQPQEIDACIRAMAAWESNGEGKRDSEARSNLVHTLLNHNDFITIR